ncbi:hypothetical protein PPACK8108_LOCUS83 [Phakopsora pachyrhizi]|uniref:Uncharacterized protein n=1 Tax=Phakopsora pachyrhizi TaxID=170000 RepID=A0AAV0ADB7_PHAPC|nr:hypothetical protein PPACK8108_LOCUS83 [Phakopsora pachyrhizi]
MIGASFHSLLITTLSATLWLAGFQSFTVQAGTTQPTLHRRQVPQEWSHGDIVRIVDTLLKKDNPSKISHTIFSLSKHLECFKKLVADQAFTNAKKDGDIKGQEAAIIFASLERNTQRVGQASKACTAIKAKNPEIERLIQHQDAASPGAKENNVLSALLAAESINEIKGDVNRAILTGTFPPAKPGQNNNAGLTCDDEKDEKGCIFTKKLFVPDITEADIKKHLSTKSKS